VRPPWLREDVFLFFVREQLWVGGLWGCGVALVKNQNWWFGSEEGNVPQKGECTEMRGLLWHHHFLLVDSVRVRYLPRFCMARRI